MILLNERTYIDTAKHQFNHKESTSLSERTCKRADGASVQGSNSSQRARRAANARDLTLDDAPVGKDVGNPWGAPKDGKQWIDARRFPEIMRK